MTHGKHVKNLGVYGEDSYFWKDSSGYFHMLFQGGDYDPSLPYYVGHWHTAWSMDALEWTVGNKTEAFNNTIQLTSGESMTFPRRERCQVLFDEKTGLPTYLFNGVTTGNDDFCFTAVQPIYVG